MSVSTETFENLGWSPRDAERHMDALPLIDEPLTDELRAGSFHRMHWAAAAVALTLFVLARLDILPAMPW